MKIRFSLLLLAIFSLLLGACSDSGKVQISDSALEVVTLQTTPSLAHWLDEAAACANALPNIGIYAELLPISSLNLEYADLTIRLGNPTVSDPFVSVLGTESLVVIAGPNAPVSSLSLDSLQGIFTGETQNWGDVPEVINAGLTINEPITVLSYLQDNTLGSQFTNIYLESDRLTDNARTFSTDNTLMDLLEANPTAIGYTLASQVPPNAQILSITGLSEITTDLYVLAITQSEPDGGLKSLLLCLQD